MAAMNGEVKMFPSIELVAPTDTPEVNTATGTRKNRVSNKPKLPGKPKTSVESRQLPGLISTVKPSTMTQLNGAQDVSILVGFNAADVKFDGEKIQYSDKIVGKTQSIVSKQAHLSTANMNNDTQIEKLESTHKDIKDGKDNIKTKGDIVVDELRNYTMMMDQFSLHNFVIYQGETLKNTPEFQSFRRLYTHEWGSISHLVSMLESIMRDYLVKLAIINGPALYELASLNKPAVTKDELLLCISNIEQIKPRLRSNVTGEIGEEVSFWQQFRAIVRMQSLVRQYLCRKRVRKIRMQLLGCIRIQAHLRKVIYRKFGLDRLRNDKHDLDDRYKATQDDLCAKFQEMEDSAALRNNASKKSAFNKTNTQLHQMVTGQLAHGEGGQRLLIHVPGISAEEYLRLDFDSFEAMQNEHIACLHQLVDPDVHILYVTPVPISIEMEAYYAKFLDMMGVSTLPRRLHFVYPELAKRLPHHLPLSQLLWCSGAALRKIKNHIRRIPNAIIIPGQISWIERRLSTMLNVPLLSCEPVVVETLKNRSYAKKTFMTASVNIPIGAHDINSTEDLFLALGRLIASNLDVNRWILRLNLDFNNESTVFLDVSKLPIVQKLRQEQTKLFEQNNGNTGSWFSRPVQLSVRKRIIHSFQNDFESRIRICRKDIYLNWYDWLSRLHRIGGVVEAEPLEKLGFVDGMVFISPTGKVTFYAGLDVFCDDRLQVQFIMGPQTCISNTALIGATEAVASHLFLKWKLIGYFTVKYQCFWDALDNIPRLWALSIACGHTPQWGAFGTAAVAMNPVPYIPDHIIPLCVPTFTSASADISESKLSEGKYCLYIPLMFHDSLKGTRDDVFFKFCIMRGIAFDIHDKTGVLFFLVDSVIGGKLSFISVANSRYRAIEQAINAITYIIQQFGKASAGREVEHIASILIGLKKVLKQEEKIAGPLAI